jgi:hypothetical protein
VHTVAVVTCALALGGMARGGPSNQHVFIKTPQ